MQLTGWLVLLGVIATGPAPGQTPSAAEILALARNGRPADAIAAYERLADGAAKSSLGVDLGYVTNRPDLALDAYRAQRRRLGTDDPALLKRFATNVAMPATTSEQPIEWTTACAAIAALAADERAAECRGRLEQTSVDTAKGWDVRGLALFAALDQHVLPSGAARTSFDNGAPDRQRLGMAIQFRWLPADERAALVAQVATGSHLHDAISAGIILGEACSGQALTALRTLAGGTRSELKNIGLLGLASCGEAASLDRLRPLASRLTEFDQLRIAAGELRLGRTEAVSRFETLAAGAPNEHRTFAWLVLSQAAPQRAVDIARRLYAAPNAGGRALLVDTMPIAPLLGPQAAVVDALASSDLPTRAAAVAWLARALSR